MILSILSHFKVVWYASKNYGQSHDTGSKKLLFRELSQHMQLELEKDCKLIERALSAFASQIDILKIKPLGSTGRNLTNTDLDDDVSMIRNLERKVCLSDGTATIKDNKVTICQALTYYHTSLQKRIELLQLGIGDIKIPFDKTQKEIDDCKELLDCLC